MPRRYTSLSAGARATERFDLRDREGFAAVYVPLVERTVLHVEASGSSTHHVLPKGMGLVEIAHPFGEGWVASLGGRYSRYDTGNVRMTIATLEKYVGD